MPWADVVEEEESAFNVMKQIGLATPEESDGEPLDTFLKDQMSVGGATEEEANWSDSQKDGGDHGSGAGIVGGPPHTVPKQWGS